MLSIFPYKLNQQLWELCPTGAKSHSFESIYLMRQFLPFHNMELINKCVVPVPQCRESLSDRE